MINKILCKLFFKKVNKLRGKISNEKRGIIKKSRLKILKRISEIF